MWSIFVYKKLVKVKLKGEEHILFKSRGVVPVISSACKRDPHPESQRAYVVLFVINRYGYFLDWHNANQSFVI